MDERGARMVVGVVAVTVETGSRVISILKSCRHVLLL